MSQKRKNWITVTSSHCVVLQPEEAARRSSVELAESIDAALPNDTAGVIYDQETAVRFMHMTTRIDEETCRRFMHAKDRYDLGLGITPSSGDTEDLELFGTTVAQLRARHPALFPKEDIEDRCMNPTTALRFIMLDAKLDEETVKHLQDAEWQYCDKLGLHVTGSADFRTN
jgi:hypothetical protein